MAPEEAVSQLIKIQLVRRHVSYDKLDHLIICHTLILRLPERTLLLDTPLIDIHQIIQDERDSQSVEVP